MYLTKEKYFEKIKSSHGYWKKAQRRWEYFEYVINFLKENKLEKILELGSFGINLTSKSDNMDLNIKFIDKDNINNKIYLQDAKNIPYDIRDKYYDAFIALQVFEHLGESQSLVFNEIKRTSKCAILSFPYKWNCPGDVSHHMITKEKIKEWTNNEIPYKIKYFFDYNKKILLIRVVYIFKF